MLTGSVTTSGLARDPGPQRLLVTHQPESITLEFIRGTKVTDLEALRARRISPVKVNRLLVRLI